jgi:hypothetical protein
LLALPSLDLLLVAFHRPPLRFLMTPLQAMHQTPDVIGMVVDAELLVDKQGNACRGPQVGGIATSQGALEEQLDQAL